IIRAYSINVAASLVGIWVFVLLGVLYQTPVVWMTILMGLLLLLASWQHPLSALDVALAVAAVVFAGLAGRETGAIEVLRSPSQKLALRHVTPDSPGPNGRIGDDVGIYRINVNNVGYQGIIDLRPEKVRQHPEKFDEKMRGLSQYDLPALLH